MFEMRCFMNPNIDPAPDDRRATGLAALEEERYAEGYRLLLPFAEDGDAEIQGILGGYMYCSLHRFESFKAFEEMNAGDVPPLDVRTTQADQEQAGRYLTAASNAGIGPASFNLASLYVGGYGVGSWEDRKARAAELYALAHDQGFTAFGNIMRRDGPGQPYLDILENYSTASGIPFPGESKQNIEPFDA